MAKVTTREYSPEAAVVIVEIMQSNEVQVFNKKIEKVSKSIERAEAKLDDFDSYMTLEAEQRAMKRLDRLYTQQSKTHQEMNELIQNKLDELRS